MNKFAQRLSELIRDAEVTQNVLATALNVKQQTISRYTSGTREPDIDLIIKIADYFDVSTDYLLGRED